MTADQGWRIPYTNLRWMGFGPRSRNRTQTIVPNDNRKQAKKYLLDAAGKIAKDYAKKSFPSAAKFAGAARRAMRIAKGKSTPYNYRTSGRYQGKFKKVTRKGTFTKFDLYNKIGVVQNTETNGNESDANTVYIINEVLNSADVIKYIVGAILRRLIEKAGIRIEGSDKCPFGNGAANQTEYKITLTKFDKRTDVLTDETFDVLAASTFDDCVDHFVNEFEQYSAGHGDFDNKNTIELHKFTLYFNAGTDKGIILSTMLMNETFIDIYGTSQMKVQNRTKAIGEGDPFDAENINNNPLQGWSYLFNGVPKAKGNSVTLGGPGVYTNFERMRYPNGISSFGGSDAGQGIHIKEPPVPRQFWNCRKASKIKIDPGVIKKFSASAFKRGNVLRVLKSIRLQCDVNGTYSTYSIFPVQMIALEDMINANAEEVISVQYEVERKLGIKCWSKQKKFYTTDHDMRTN